MSPTENTSPQLSQKSRVNAELSTSKPLQLVDNESITKNEGRSHVQF